MTVPPDSSPDPRSSAATRRAFLRGSAGGLGGLALATLLGKDASAGDGAASGHWPGALRPLHVPPKAKAVIFLCMAGGPSQFESFSYKPELARLDGQPMPESFTRGQPIAQLQGHALNVLGPRAKFRRAGQSGHYVSDYFPHLASVADKLCVVHSLQTEQINHDPAHTFMNTGTSISGRPSMGAWATYGLGSAARDLPGFVVLTSRGGRNPQPISTRQWNAGFLPSRFQGVELQGAGAPVPYVTSPPGIDEAAQERVVNATSSLNRFANASLQDPELETRVRAYELAFRMQTSVPELLDLRQESDAVLGEYGLDVAKARSQFAADSFASNCLLARRLVERGVRFVQLYHRGWDHHNDLDKFMPVCAGHTDQAAAALLRDLDRRGMLDETLVIWTGEFGRTPMSQTNKGGPGRDHHMRAFTGWLAGAGVRAGASYGETDELGYGVTADPVHVHDLHATMLHLLGVDHERLTWRYRGRDFRLTDVHGRVVSGILA